MKSFRDPSLKSSLFLLELVAAIETRAVSWDLVNAAETPEDQMVFIFIPSVIALIYIVIIIIIVIIGTVVITKNKDNESFNCTILFSCIFYFSSIDEMLNFD